MEDVVAKPELVLKEEYRTKFLQIEHSAAGQYFLYAEDASAWLFTENETNFQKLYGQANPSPYVKDAFHRYLIEKDVQAINPEQKGTKAAAHFYHDRW